MAMPSAGVCRSVLMVSSSMGKAWLGFPIPCLSPCKTKPIDSHLPLTPATSTKLSTSYSVSRDQAERGSSKPLVPSEAAMAMSPTGVEAGPENNEPISSLISSIFQQQQLDLMRVPKGGWMGVMAAASTGTIITSSDARALQEMSSIAEGDSRGLLLLLVLAPALGWVLFNILQPALNQINKMRQKK